MKLLSKADLPMDAIDLMLISRQPVLPTGYGAWAFDVESGEIWWSDEIDRVCSSSSGEWYDATHKTARPAVAAWAKASISSMIPSETEQWREFNLEVPTCGRMTKLVRFRWHSGAIRHSSKSVSGIAFMYDLQAKEVASSSLKLTERLQQINHFRQFAIEAAEIGIWEWNAARGEATHIENCLELLGLGSAELRAQCKGLTSKEWAERIHPDDRHTHEDVFDKYLQGHSGALDIDHRMLHADGTYRWFNTHGKVVEWDGNGRPLRMAGIFRDIHQRKMTELGSQENEARFRGIFENTRRLVGLLTPEGKNIITNPVGYAFTGLTPAETSALHFWEGHWWLSDDDRNKIQDAVRKAASGETVQLEIGQRAANGAIYTSDFSIAPIFDDKKSVTLLLAEANDITDLKLLQQELNLSEKLFREAFELGPVGATILDCEGRYLEVNEGFARMLGYQRHELVGRHSHEITVPGESIDLLAMHQLIQNGGGRTTLTKRYVHRDGGIIDASLEVATIAGDFYRPDENLRFLSFAQDLTELHRTQQALHTSELRSDLAVASAGIGVWEWDTQRDLGFYSQRACEILDVGPTEITTQKTWMALIHPDDLAGYLTTRGSHLEGKIPLYKCELRILQKNGTYKWVDDFGKVIERDETGQPLRMVGTLRDITESVEQHQRIQRLAFSDSLTTLPNRALFNSRCESALIRARISREIFALMIIDLDHFKDVNDTLGHVAGDQLLCEASVRLSDCLRSGDMLARLGGDEFAVILENLPDQLVIADVAERLLRSLAPPFRITGQDLFVTASIGIATYPTQGSAANELFARADAALYEAKARGRNNFQFYDEVFTRKTELKLKLGNSLRMACANDELELDYQAKVELETGRIIGAEALLRWRHPELGLLMPDAFIRLAEENGAIVEIGRWVIRQAAGTIASWNRGRRETMKIAINLSARQFVQNDLVMQVRDALEETGCRSNWLECEITESLLLKDESCVQETLRQLHDLGVSIAIDDFGTGQSALAYLNRFPIDVLKIDRSFITEMNNDVRGKELVKAFILIANALDMETVAEGVETAEQARTLSALGCGIGQGYFYGKPMPLIDFNRTIAGSGNSRVANALVGPTRQ